VTITLYNAAGAVLMRHEHDGDPYAGQRRVILQDDSLFERGQAAQRRKTYACSVRLAEAGKPIAHHLPASTERITVESARYTARYRMERLCWHSLELFLPEGEGKTAFGDFTPWELQRYAYEWAYPPIGWTSESGWLYVRAAEDSPFQGDDARGEALARALARSRRDWDKYCLHILGKNLSYGRLLRDAPVVAPSRPARKRTGVRQ
jgi:hypothetical protein